jgi:hypothetical protein
MNNPYPTRAELRAEDLEDRLMANQLAFNSALSKWLRLALETLPEPEHPLMWPCDNVDREDIEQLMRDALAMISGLDLADFVRDTVQEMSE